MLHILLLPALNVVYSYFSTFRSMCALPNMAVFCYSLADIFLRYILNDFEMFPVVHFITGITSFLYFTSAVFILQGLYSLKSFGLFLFSIAFLSPEITKSIKKHGTLFQNCTK